MGVHIPIGFGHWVLPFKLSTDPQTMVVTMGYKNESALSENAQAEAIQDALFTTASWAASSISSSWTVGPATVTVMTALGPQAGEATTTRVGTAGTMETPPQNCTWLVQKRTARGGRSGRGRLYFPLCNIAEINVERNGTIASSPVSSMQVNMNSWRATCASVGLPLYLLHSPLPDGGGPPLIPPDAITNLLVDDVIATQRKRLRR